MSRRFVPPAVQNADYNVSAPRVGQFTPNPPSLLGDIGSKMRVTRARTEGRVPSPVSRAYMFYVNLFGRTLGTLAAPDDGADVDGALSPEREVLREDARAAFRGVVTTFALRDVLGLDVRLAAVPVTPGADPVSTVLRPALQSAPGGEAFWNPVRLYLAGPVGGEADVLAGLSPLTGVFPSATPPRRLTGLYWYDPEGGRWFDPTGDRFDEAGDLVVAPPTVARVRAMLKAWLLKVTQALQPGSLAGVPIEAQYEALIREELDLWRQDLVQVAAADDAEVTERPMGDPSGPRGLPFLDWTVQADPALVLSDLPVHDGRLVVTQEQVATKSTRLYGRQLGGRDLEQAARALPATGDNLGMALGIGPHAVPVPFVCVDKLFTPKIAPVTSEGLSEGWRGLAVDTPSGREHCLFPFQPEILELVPAAELAERCSGELSQDGQYYIVRLRFGPAEIVKRYAFQGEGEYVVDSVVQPDTVDLRVFPNFDLGSVGALLPSDEDGRYYARARLSPDWDFRVSAFGLDAGRVVPNLGEVRVVGDDASGGAGRAAFFEADRQPAGFDFGGRGFCLYTFPSPVPDGLNEVRWEVAIDFGTSNTCLSYRVAGTTAPAKILPLPVFTTSLLATPIYSARLGDTQEGASAALDFFYLYDGSTDVLVGAGGADGRDYFPTQFVTRQSAPSGRDEFVLGDGLVFFENISLSDKALWELIEGSPLPGEVPQRFRLKQDVKWQHTDWLRAFMRHLRKHVVLAAAHEGARIERVVFSYPKAFTLERRMQFTDDMRHVWVNGMDTPPELIPLSESEAVREIVTRDQNEAVVFDIGGGTTDIIAFSTGEPVYQTSFEVAARQVNEYVLASPPFRKAFVDALREAAGRAFVEEAHLDETGFEREGTPDTIRDLWLGLLQSVERYDPSGRVLESALTRLRTRAGSEDSKPVRGFFLTLAVLFPGLAYYAGQLMASASSGSFGRGFSVQNVRLLLTGNGSKFYRMLGVDAAPFAPVMERMFRVGLGREDAVVECTGVYALDGREAPKVTVALGMLQQSGSEDRPVPVANVAGERGFRANGVMTEEGSQLASFYSALADHKLEFEPPHEAPPNLQRFAGALGDALPYGKHGQFSVVPHAGKDWHEELTGGLYRSSRGAVKRRAVHTAEVLQRQLQGVAESDLPALEPLFVTELAALLEAVRTTHAGG